MAVMEHIKHFHWSYDECRLGFSKTVTRLRRACLYIPSIARWMTSLSAAMHPGILGLLHPLQLCNLTQGPLLRQSVSTLSVRHRPPPHKTSVCPDSQLRRSDYTVSERYMVGSALTHSTLLGAARTSQPPPVLNQDRPHSSCASTS